MITADGTGLYVSGLTAHPTPVPTAIWPPQLSHRMRHAKRGLPNPSRAGLTCPNPTARGSRVEPSIGLAVGTALAAPASAGVHANAARPTRPATRFMPPPYKSTGQFTSNEEQHGCFGGLHPFVPLASGRVVCHESAALGESLSSELKSLRAHGCTIHRRATSRVS